MPKSSTSAAGAAVSAADRRRAASKAAWHIAATMNVTAEVLRHMSAEFSQPRLSQALDDAAAMLDFAGEEMDDILTELGE